MPFLGLLILYWINLKVENIIKPKGQPPYSSTMLLFALHWRYTSAQAFTLTAHTYSAIIMSLRAQAMLTNELLEEGYC